MPLPTCAPRLGLGRFAPSLDDLPLASKSSNEVAIPARKPSPATEGKGASSGPDSKGKFVKKKNAGKRPQRGENLVGALIKSVYMLEGERDAKKQVNFEKVVAIDEIPTSADVREGKEDESPKKKLEKAMEFMVVTQKEKQVLNPAVLQLTRKSYFTLTNSLGGLIDSISTFIGGWFGPSSVFRPLKVPPARKVSSLKVCDLTFDSGAWMFVTGLQVGLMSIYNVCIYKSWWYDVSLFHCFSSILGLPTLLTPLAGVIQHWSNYETDLIPGNLMLVRGLNFLFRGFGRLFCWITERLLIASSASWAWYVCKLVPPFFGVYFLYRVFLNLWHGMVLIHNDTVELRMEIVDTEVVVPDMVPSFNLDDVQARRNIFRAVPYIAVKTLLAEHMIEFPVLSLDTREFQNGWKFREFYLSQNLLPELLNQKTLLANWSDPRVYKDRLVRFAESFGQGQDSFSEFLRGRDAYRDTIQFCLARATNCSQVRQLFEAVLPLNK